jgi:hypothetical protein
MIMESGPRAAAGGAPGGVGPRAAGAAGGGGRRYGVVRPRTSAAARLLVRAAP